MRIPKTLYHYGKLNEDILPSLYRHVIRLESPDKLNDPAELYINARGRDINAALYNVRSMKKGTLEENFKQMVNEAFINRARIFSFSAVKPWTTTCRNMPELMWAHYGAASRGICVEYNIGRWLHKELLHPVAYRAKPEDCTKEMLRFVGGDTAECGWILRCACEKPLAWSYEREYRVVCEGVSELAAPAIRHIYIGSRAEDNAIRAVRDFAAREHIGISQITLHRYRLVTEPRE